MDKVPECEGEHVISCKRIKIDLDAIDSMDNITIPEIGTVLSRDEDLDQEEDGTEDHTYTVSFT